MVTPFRQARLSKSVAVPGGDAAEVGVQALLGVRVGVRFHQGHQALDVRVGGGDSGKPDGKRVALEDRGKALARRQGPLRGPRAPRRSAALLRPDRRAGLSTPAHAPD